MTFEMGRKGRTLCRWVLAALALAWLFSLGIFAAGTYGWFGVEKDPLSSVFLVILGMPWVLLPFDEVVGEARLPLVGILAPLVNLGIVWMLCRLFR